MTKTTQEPTTGDTHVYCSAPGSGAGSWGRGKGRPHPDCDFHRKSQSDLSRCALTDVTAAAVTSISAGEMPEKDSPLSLRTERLFRWETDQEAGI